LIAMPGAHSPLAAWDAVPASRRLLLGAATVVVVIVALAAATGPMTEAIGRTRSDIARTKQLIDVARERNADSAGLARGNVAVRTVDVRTAVDGTLARHALRAAPAAANTADGRYAIVIDDGRFESIVIALDSLARDEGVRVIEATFTARVEPGRVRADLAFVR
jgi:type II secretory pathway component PulM